MKLRKLGVLLLDDDLEKKILTWLNDDSLLYNYNSSIENEQRE